MGFRLSSIGLVLRENWLGRGGVSVPDMFMPLCGRGLPDGRRSISSRRTVENPFFVLVMY